MHRYKINLTLGVHHYGNIYRAEHIETGQMFLIEEHNKNCNSWEECISLRQVKVLRVLNHPNIIKLKEIIRQDKILFLIFEYFDTTLLSWYNQIQDLKKTISQNLIKKIIFQTSLAISQCHQNGIMHRDLCPENIFITKDLDVKVGQFGNAEFQKKQNQTQYITTRWYRSPEAILKLHQNTRIDIWALGCVMAELYLQRPIFMGNSELDQLMQILSIMGIPNHKEYPEFHTLCQSREIIIPKCNGLGLSFLIPHASPEAIDLMNQMFNINPVKRISIQKVLIHPFFKDVEQLNEVQKILSDKRINLNEQDQKNKQEDLQKALAINLQIKNKGSQDDCSSDEGEQDKSSNRSSSPSSKLISDSPSNSNGVIRRMSMFGQQNKLQEQQISQFTSTKEGKGEETNTENKGNVSSNSDIDSHNEGQDDVKSLNLIKQEKKSEQFTKEQQNIKQQYAK